jgi:hypothetical protein
LIFARGDVVSPRYDTRFRRHGVVIKSTKILFVVMAAVARCPMAVRAQFQDSLPRLWWIMATKKIFKFSLVTLCRGWWMRKS